jgi:ubiquitin-protein ligase
MVGPENTPFEGGFFVIKFVMEGFPFKAPLLNF